MKLHLIVIFAFCLFLPSITVAQAKSSLANLGWLGGCWELNSAERNLLITEQWMKPAGGMMIGAGRTVRGGRVVDYEFLRIIEESEGIFYVAKPTANKEETRFKLMSLSPDQIVFENPTHDFPQRIIYKLAGDKLSARIEGTRDGKTRGIDFPYTRAKCE